MTMTAMELAELIRLRLIALGKSHDNKCPDCGTAEREQCSVCAGHKVKP